MPPGDASPLLAFGGVQAPVIPSSEVPNDPELFEHVRILECGLTEDGWTIAGHIVASRTTDSVYDIVINVTDSYSRAIGSLEISLAVIDGTTSWQESYDIDPGVGGQCVLMGVTAAKI